MRRSFAVPLSGCWQNKHEHHRSHNGCNQNPSYYRFLRQRNQPVDSGKEGIPWQLSPKRQTPCHIDSVRLSRLSFPKAGPPIFWTQQHLSLLRTAIRLSVVSDREQKHLLLPTFPTSSILVTTRSGDPVKPTLYISCHPELQCRHLWHLISSKCFHPSHRNQNQTSHRAYPNV